MPTPDPHTTLQFDHVQNWILDLRGGGQIVLALKGKYSALTHNDKRFVQDLIEVMRAYYGASAVPGVAEL